MKFYFGAPRNPPMELLFGDGWLRQNVGSIWGLSIGTTFFGFFRINKTHVDYRKDPRGRIVTNKTRTDGQTSNE